VKPIFSGARWEISLDERVKSLETPPLGVHDVHQMAAGGWEWAATRRVPHNLGLGIY